MRGCTRVPLIDNSDNLSIRFTLGKILKQNKVHKLYKSTSCLYSLSFSENPFFTASRKIIIDYEDRNCI